MKYVLCIDQGTTSTKAFLLDEQGRLSSGTHVPFEQHYPNPGWVEHDAEEIYQSVLKAIAMLIAENPDAKILFIGASDKMEMRRVPEAGYPIEGLEIYGIHRDLSPTGIMCNLRLPVVMM